jgi:hypothetical protein
MLQTVHLEKLTADQRVKKFPALYGAQKYITMFTRAHHWSLHGATWIQSKFSRPICFTCILILSSNPLLDLLFLFHEKPQSEQRPLRAGDRKLGPPNT